MSEPGGEPRIVFDSVWKKFRRGELHDSLSELIPAIARRLAGRGEPVMREEEFWALQDVSFEVGPGEAIGIIGSNGAGKSTVLKILTRILRPDRGRFEVAGRVGALIELAAGFHPDLTGRENVFLQGAVMGMSRAQITERFDEIVAFSGVEDAIETPVKRYSSGMNARLGFSIAAHLDPDVLIIDEVLSVGDFAFQRKAFGRIQTLVRSGIPVAIVSHQLNRVDELCTEAMVLDQGVVVHKGTPAECIAEYLKPENASSKQLEGPKIVDFGRIAAVDDLEPVSGGRIRIVVEGEMLVESDLDRIEPLGILVRSARTGDILFVCGSTTTGIELHPGRFSVEVSLQLNVPPGVYLIETAVFDRIKETALALGPSLSVRVTEGPIFVGSVQMHAAMTLAPATDTS